MTTMCQRAGVLLAVAVLFGSQTAWAQAVFRVSSSTTTVIRTGHAEPGGGVDVLGRWRYHCRRHH